MAVDPFDAVERDRPRGFPLDKTFFGIGLVYLVSVLLWLNYQQQLPWSAQKTQSTPSPSLGDRQFIAYLQQSLQTLDRSVKSAKAIPPTATVPVYPNAPTPQVERIYVPVYPPVQASQPQSLPLKVLPPVPQPQPQLQPQRPKIAIAPPPLPPPPPMSTIPTLSAPSRALPPVSAPAPPANHSLVGLLASGEQSTVLITVNGTTQRFALGEAIGGSGWVLQAVNNNHALISRQGKTRSVEVGQSF